MVQVVPAATQDAPLSLHRDRITATFAVILLGAILGYLGWVLPSVGGSVILPTLVVFGIGAAVALVSALVARKRPRRSALHVFTLGAVIVTILGAIWTFQFSLPASIRFSNATAQAESALSQLNTSVHQYGVASTPLCSMHATGSIGPLQAPYVECASGSSPSADSLGFVTFRKAGTEPGESGALGYAPAGLNIFPDECVRHLVGDWSMTAGPSENVGDPGACPVGYSFQPGG